MRQKHKRIGRPSILFNNGILSKDFDGSISITQTEKFLLEQLSINDTMSGSVTGSISSGDPGAIVPFRTGVYRCTSQKIDITNYSRLRMRATYSFSSGDTYGDYHFRRIFMALLSDTACYVNAAGLYLSNDSSPSADNAVPQVNRSFSVGSAGEISLTLDISELTGSYYIALGALLKACSSTAMLNVLNIWLE